MVVTEMMTVQELDAQRAEFLPERETLDLISANVAAPVNAAVAANVLTADSVAVASATQTATILQDIGGG
jgi:hypothetical protein